MRAAIDSLFCWLADALGSNGSIILFTLIAFVPLAYHLPTGVLEWQAWLSQVCIQLIALAVIQKGGKTSETRIMGYLQESHDAHMVELAEIRGLRALEQHEIEVLDDIHAHHHDEE